MRSPIINRADLQTVQQRTITGVLTLGFWVFWLYLWLPLLSLFAWWLGLEQAYKYMVVLGGYEEMARLLGLYTVIILVMAGILYGWATYNILRHGGRDRRTTNKAPTLEEIARSFGQGPVAVGSWREAQRLYVTHDEKGAIAKVDVLATGAPVPEEQSPVPRPRNALLPG